MLSMDDEDNFMDIMDIHSNDKQETVQMVTRHNPLYFSSWSDDYHPEWIRWRLIWYGGPIN
jgi:hypothetical protein